MSSRSNLASFISFGLALVDLIPLRFLCMCPLAVAVEGGKCFSREGTNPGNELSCLFFIALRSVVVGGENND